MFTHPSPASTSYGALYVILEETVHSGEKFNNVMLADPSPPSTSYGALYLASQVYGGPLGLWVKVIQFA